MKKLTLLLLCVILLNSCASIFNKDTTVVKISANTESQVVFKQDTLKINREQITIRPKRSREAIKLTVLKDSLQKDVYLESKLSTIFWANILYNYGLGLLVDLTNDKRFTYKHNLHFVTGSLSNTIELSTKKITVLPKNTFFVYTSPLQFLDFFNIPMGTLGIEYFPVDNFSTSAEFGYRGSDFYSREDNLQLLDEKARMLRFEGKWYNAINFTGNVHLNEYLGIEYRELKSQYNDNINYSTTDNTGNFVSISNDFATVKTVSMVNVKYGLLVPLGDKMYFDFYSGLGVRIKRFDHQNLEYNREIHDLEFDDSIFDFRTFRDYDKRSFLNLSLGFKFGIKL